MNEAGVPPVNVQFQLVGLYVLRFVKIVDPPALIVVLLATKSAIGALFRLVETQAMAAAASIRPLPSCPR
ncbi:hypothetical protein D3C86_1163990 [compost metagenome]